MNTTERIVVLGAGGHAKVLIDLILLQEKYEIVGLLDRDPSSHGKLLHGFEILGSDNLLETLRRDNVNSVCFGIGSTGEHGIRKRLFELALSKQFAAPVLIHPRAHVASSARIGSATVVMANALIGVDAVLGQNIIVNSGAIIEHDCHVGNHVHLAPACTLNGGVVIDDSCFVGSNSTILNNCVIGKGSIVGAGSVVVDDVPSGVVAYGVPARVHRKVALGEHL